MADTTRVQNGYLIPNVESLKELLLVLKEEIKSNPELAKEFKLNPGAVLGSRGFSLPIQKQLLAEDGTLQQAEHAAALCSCIHTNSCVFTGGSC